MSHQLITVSRVELKPTFLCFTNVLKIKKSTQPNKYAILTRKVFKAPCFIKQSKRTCIFNYNNKLALQMFLTQLLPKLLAFLFNVMNCM